MRSSYCLMVYIVLYIPSAFSREGICTIADFSFVITSEGIGCINFLLYIIIINPPVLQVNGEGGIKKHFLIFLQCNYMAPPPLDNSSRWLYNNVNEKHGRTQP